MSIAAPIHRVGAARYELAHAAERSVPARQRLLPSRGVVLLDRGAQLQLLAASIEEARRGSGGSVVVRGEAGCGKTSLVRAALADVEDRVRVVWTSCEPLTAPRPLAPIVDAHRQLLGDRAGDGTRIGPLFEALRDQPVALVIEDLHWADDATLDVVTRLAARMAATPSTMLVTFRPSGAEPLRGVLGQLARTEARYVETPPLSRTSVAALAADADRDGDAVFELTAGVPFLVAAVLTAPGMTLPDSAADAILASTAGLDESGRTALEVISCVPRVGSSRDSDEALVPFAVLELGGVDAGAIDAAERTGLIEVGRAGAAFRHELGRLAVESTLSGARRRIIHASLRDAFRSSGADAAVIAHHAIRAGDDQDIIDACDEAARVATEAGALRQACALLAEAVDAARRTRDDRLVDLAERSARQRYLTNDLAGAIEHQRVALGILLAGEDPERVAASHLRLSRYSWFRGDRANAAAHVDTALGVLAKWPTGEAMAEALIGRCQLAMLQGDRAVAERSAAEALELLGADRRPDLRAAVLTNIGSVRLLAGDAEGLTQLRAGIDVASQVGGEEYVRGCLNAAYVLTEVRRLSAAEPYLARGLRYAQEQELDTWLYYLIGIRARWRMLHGNTSAAIEDADLTDSDDRNDLNRILPALVRGTIAARAGADEADRHLGEALELTHRFGEAHRTGPVLAAVAERAWLQGTDAPVDQLMHFLDDAAGRIGPMLTGEIAAWLVRLGAPVVHVDCAGTPYALARDGDHQAAARVWAELQAPYDRALSLIDDGQPDSLLEARRICDPLGATATVDIIDHHLVRAGAPIPRGPRPSTQANVALLTSRQLEVLDLLARGYTNAQIAEELFISLKTAGHHVSAIFIKLGAKRRTEAVAIARQLGLVHDGAG